MTKAQIMWPQIHKKTQTLHTTLKWICSISKHAEWNFLESLSLSMNMLLHLCTWCANISILNNVFSNNKKHRSCNQKPLSRHNNCIEAWSLLFWFTWNRLLMKVCLFQLMLFFIFELSVLVFHCQMLCLFQQEKVQNMEPKPEMQT